MLWCFRRRPKSASPRVTRRSLRRQCLRAGPERNHCPKPSRDPAEPSSVPTRPVRAPGPRSGRPLREHGAPGPTLALRLEPGQRGQTQPSHHFSVSLSRLSAPIAEDNAEGPPGEQGGPESLRTRGGTISSQSGKAGIGSSQFSKAVALLTKHLQVRPCQPCPCSRSHTVSPVPCSSGEQFAPSNLTQGISVNGEAVEEQAYKVP